MYWCIYVWVYVCMCVYGCVCVGMCVCMHVCVRGIDLLTISVPNSQSLRRRKWTQLCQFV